MPLPDPDETTPPGADAFLFGEGPLPSAQGPVPDAPPLADLWATLMARWIGETEPPAPEPPPADEIWW